MGSVNQHGYLAIADISGYTSFAAKTELDPSRAILSEVLNLPVEKIEPLMTFSKLAGEALFAAYGGEKRSGAERRCWSPWKASTWLFVTGRLR
jgi:hypothetical protein